MKTKLPIIVVCLMTINLLFSSCLTSKKTDVKKVVAYENFYTERPLSILIMPPINQTDDEDAKEDLYATLTQSVAEAGYYTFPMVLSAELLKKNNLYDSENIVNNKLNNYNEDFGADVLMFTVIKQWEKDLAKKTIVLKIQYVFKSAKTNKIIYNRTATYTYKSDRSSSSDCLGSLCSLTASIIDTAVTSYTSIAESCNSFVLDGDLPKGRYNPNCGKDREEYSEYAEIKN